MVHFRLWYNQFCLLLACRICDRYLRPTSSPALLLADEYVLSAMLLVLPIAYLMSSGWDLVCWCHV